jgi:predicted acylesterase/phospholipase RssA
MRAQGHRPRVVFVASGGALKAYSFHVGVLKGLSEDGFHFRSGLRWQPLQARPGQREIDGYVGSSAGACVAASLAAGHPWETLLEAVLCTSKDVPHFNWRTLFVPVAPNPLKYLRRLARRRRFGGIRAHHLVDVGGLFTASGVERYFRRYVMPTNCFTDLAAALFLTATQVNSSRKVVFGPLDSLGPGGYDPYCAYYSNVPVSQAVAASVSVPPFFAPFGIVNPESGNLIHYYDGEVRETLSVHVARDAGADFVVASSIWRPYAYDENVGSLAEFGMSSIAEQALQQAIEQKVNQYRRQSVVFDEVLEAIRAHLGRAGVPAEISDSLQIRVRELLRHRSMRSLYVTPDPRDFDFLFSGSFRFDRPFLEACFEAGYQSYKITERQDFLDALDLAIGAPAREEPPTPLLPRDQG